MIEALLSRCGIFSKYRNALLDFIKTVQIHVLQHDCFSHTFGEKKIDQKMTYSMRNQSVKSNNKVLSYDTNNFYLKVS